MVIQRLTRSKLGLLLAIVIVSGFIIWSVQTSKYERHLSTVKNTLDLVVKGLERLPDKRLQMLTRATENSWRQTFALYYPWEIDDIERPDDQVSWQSDEFARWDNFCQGIFTLDKLTDVSREKRFTGLMAVLGKGTAFEYMQEHGFDELRRFAPNAILLVEVINSKVPWMQAGDLEVGKIPHQINSKDRLGIGSSKGYDKFGVGFADGTVWILDASVTFDALQKFLTTESARKHDRQETLGKYVVKTNGATMND